MKVLKNKHGSTFVSSKEFHFFDKLRSEKGIYEYELSENEVLENTKREKVHFIRYANPKEGDRNISQHDASFQMLLRHFLQVTRS